MSADANEQGKKINLNIMIVGAKNTGKSALMSSFISNNCDTSHGNDGFLVSGALQYNDAVDLVIQDYPDPDINFDDIHGYINKANVFLLTFNEEEDPDLSKLKKWVNQINGNNVPVILVRTKADIQYTAEQFTKEKIEESINSNETNNFKFSSEICTSAKDKIGIDLLLQEATRLSLIDLVNKKHRNDSQSTAINEGKVKLNITIIGKEKKERNSLMQMFFDNPLEEYITDFVESQKLSYHPTTDLEISTLTNNESQYYDSSTYINRANVCLLTFDGLQESISSLNCLINSTCRVGVPIILVRTSTMQQTLTTEQIEEGIKIGDGTDKFRFACDISISEKNREEMVQLLIATILSDEKNRRDKNLPVSLDNSDFDKNLTVDESNCCAKLFNAYKDLAAQYPYATSISLSILVFAIVAVVTFFTAGLGLLPLAIAGSSFYAPLLVGGLAGLITGGWSFIANKNTNDADHKLDNGHSNPEYSNPNSLYYQG